MGLTAERDSVRLRRTKDSKRRSLTERYLRRVVGEELERLRLRNDVADTLIPSLPKVLALPRATKELILNASDYSMLSLKRLLSIHALATALGGRVPGVFAEFGVARGGVAGLLATIASRQNRETWLFDSFEGLPQPDARDGTAAREYAAGRATGALEPIGKCVAGVEEVLGVLRRTFAVDLNRVHLVPGWFQNTRGDFPNLPIAFLHLDGDWYESDRFVLDNYFDLVAPGGLVVVDDYGWWEGARRAVDEFMEDRGLRCLVRVGSQQAYFEAPEQRLRAWTSVR